VEPPQPGRAMHEHMPEIKRVVHQRHGERRFEPAGHRPLFEQPPPAPLDSRNERSDKGPLADLQRNCAQRRQRKISDAASELGFNGAAQRPAMLEPE
jgi:hypothetical protein